MNQKYTAPRSAFSIPSQKPMRFQNAWTFANVRRKAAEVKASRTIRHELKHSFRELYKEEVQRAKEESRSVKSRKELFSELLRHQTKDRMDRMLLAIEGGNQINRSGCEGGDLANLRDARGGADGSKGEHRRDGGATFETTMASACSRDVDSALSRAKQRVRERHQTRNGLELNCRVDILNRNKMALWADCGVLRYLGSLHFTSGKWAGVELDRQYAGKNNGTVEGRRYFLTKGPDRGIFVRVECCQRATASNSHLTPRRSRRREISDDSDSNSVEARSECIREKRSNGSRRRRRNGGSNDSDSGGGEGGENEQSDGASAEETGAGSPTKQRALQQYKDMQMNPDFSKYFSMLKVGVPRSGVAQKMLSDGMTMDVVRNFLTQGETNPEAVNDMQVLLVKKQHLVASKDATDPRLDQKRFHINAGLRKVHWESLPPEVARVSIFGVGSLQIESRERLSARDMMALKALYGQSRTPSPKKNKSRMKGHRNPLATLISNQRATNIGIMLSKFKQFLTYGDIARAVLTLDPRLTSEMIQALGQMVPTEIEAPRLLSYHGSMDGLTNGEKFCLAMIPIPRVQKKIEALLFCDNAEENLERMQKNITVFLSAVAEIISSRRLVRIFRFFLLVGNTMNSEKSSGFSLESLIKLALTKSTSKSPKLILLDFLVQSVAENGEGDLLDVFKDLKSLPAASLLPDVSVIISEGKQLRSELSKTRNEVTSENRRRQEEKDAFAEEAKRGGQSLRSNEETNSHYVVAPTEGGILYRSPLSLAAPSSGRLALQAVFGAATAEAKSSRDDETAEPMPPNTAPLALKDDPAFARYFKMLKMHLPRGAVVLKMQTDGVDPSILDRDPDALSPNQRSLCTNGPASSLLQPPCLRSQPGEGGGHKPPSGSRGNPMADLMAGIAGGAAKLKKRRTALSGGGGTAHGIYGPERDKFIEKMSTRIDVAGRKIESLLDQINEAEVQCRTLREYFGESGSALESHRIFSTLKHFVDLLAQSKRAYERAHGHVVVVTSRRRSASYLTEYGDGDGYLESHMWAVNTCVATQFGSGAIEAVRVKEHVYMVRLKWGVGFLQRSAIIDVNCIVDTPYGRGRVVAVNDPISYQVELIWGYALLQPESVLWTGDVYSIVVESETNSNSDSDVSVASYDDGNWNSLGNSDESGSFGLSESDSDFEGEEGGEEEGKYDAF